MRTHPIARLVQFVRQGVWEVQLQHRPGSQRLGFAVLRVALHVVRSFSRNVVGLTAAGLTLVTVLSLVPILGLVFAIGKALGYAELLDQKLMGLGSTLPADAQGAVTRIREMVAEINFGTMGVLGSVVVVWSGLVLFTRVEQALNGIWRTRHRRPWLRRMTDFIALVVMVPPFAIVALLGSSLLRSTAWIEPLRAIPGFAWLHDAGLGFVPHAMSWIAFTALYKLMPSVRVEWRSALAGGVVAGSSLVWVQGLYLYFQVGVAQANAIYATMAALPLLLIYLQLLWTVVLVGGEVSYAVQNLGNLHGDEVPPTATVGVRQRVMWHLMARAAAAFRAGRKGARLSSLATAMDLPRPWVDEAADQLVQAGLLVPAQGDEELLLPGRPPETIAMSDLLLALEGRGAPELQRVSLPDAEERQLTAALDLAAREVSRLVF